MTDVTQEDREAAADLVKWQQNATKQWKQGEDEAWQFFAAGFSRAIRQGIWDEHPLVQAFARHRQATASSLAAENERLRAALMPFAEHAEFYESCEAHPNGCPDDAQAGEIIDVSVGDFRRARAALQGE